METRHSNFGNLKRKDCLGVCRNFKSFKLIFPVYCIFVSLFAFLILFSACDSISTNWNFFKSKKIRYNIILIAIDTLRADYLGCYGKRDSITPNIDKFAKESFLFEQCLAPSSWTLPSFMSIFTSLYPTQHTMLSKSILFTNKKSLEQIPPELPDDIPTITEYFSKAGYTCYGIVANHFLDPRWGFKKGFFKYNNYGHTQKASQQTQRAITLLNEIKDKKPFFLFLHYIDPHAPYSPPTPFDKIIESDDYIINKLQSLNSNEKLVSISSNHNSESDLNILKAQYSGEISFVDHEIGKLLKEFSKLDLLRDTIIILTSDHGEEFKEHNGIGHGKTLYEDQLLVPLIIKAPDLPKSDIFQDLVSLIDLPTTVMNLIHLKLPDNFQGKILPGFSNVIGGSYDDRKIYADMEEINAIISYPIKLLKNTHSIDNLGDKQNIEAYSNTASENKSKQPDNDEKLNPITFDNIKSNSMPSIISANGEYYQAFNIKTDPLERFDIINDPNYSSIVKNLKKELELHNKNKRINSSLKYPDKKIPDDILKNLRTLGYIQ